MPLTSQDIAAPLEAGDLAQAAQGALRRAASLEKKRSLLSAVPAGIVLPAVAVACDGHPEASLAAAGAVFFTAFQCVSAMRIFSWRQAVEQALTLRRDENEMFRRCESMRPRGFVEPLVARMGQKISARCLHTADQASACVRDLLSVEPAGYLSLPVRVSDKRPARLPLPEFTD